MKVELSFLTLVLVVSCTAAAVQKYELKCTEKEIDILWPVYEDSAKYLRCASIGKHVEMKCNAGTVFSFVYQGCVMIDEYIPPPPVDNLPLDNGPPSDDETTTEGSTTTTSTKPPLTLPTPQHPPSTKKPTKPTKPTTTTTEAAPTAPGPPTGSPPAPPTGSPPGPPTGSPPGPPTGGPPGPPTPARPTAGPGVPGPPSPPATGVPMPNTPAPTPPVIDNSPPNVGVTLSSDDARRKK